jgi:hypothetical protein
MATGTSLDLDFKGMDIVTILAFVQRVSRKGASVFFAVYI